MPVYLIARMCLDYQQFLVPIRGLSVVPSPFPPFVQPTVFISASRDMDAVAKRIHARLLTLARDFNDDFAPYYYSEDEAERIWSTHTTWQNNIPRAGDPQVVVTISLFGERLGVPLPGYFPLPEELGGEVSDPFWFSPTGEPAPEGMLPLTGTAFEFLDARWSVRPENGPGRRAQSGPGMPEPKHLTYFVGPETIRDTSLGDTDRKWGNQSYKLAQFGGNEAADAAYWAQVKQLSRFHDWAAGKAGIPIDYVLSHDALVDRAVDAVRRLFEEARGSWRELKGLDAYLMQDRAHFRGRRDWVRQVIGRLTSASEAASAGGPDVALLITGVSGMGKSSCLQAGLLGELQRLHFRLDAVDRIWLANLSVRDMVAAADPLKALCDAICASGLALANSGEDLAALLRGTATEARAAKFCRIIAAALSTSSGKGQHTRLLVAIDQLEEIVDQTDADGTLPAEWMLPLDLVLAAVDARLVWLVGTLSSERRDRFRAALGPRLDRFQAPLPVRNPENIEEIVAGSLASVGLKAEPELMTAILREARAFLDEARAADGEDSPVLPLLSMLLTKLVRDHKSRSAGLSRHLDREQGGSNLLTYEAHKDKLGFATVIEDLAEATWAEAAKDAAALSLDFSRLMAALVGMRRDEDSFIPELRLARVTARRLSGCAQLARSLRSARVLTGSRQDGYRLAHAAILRHWPAPPAGSTHGMRLQRRRQNSRSSPGAGGAWETAKSQHICCRGRQISLSSCNSSACAATDSAMS